MGSKYGFLTSSQTFSPPRAVRKASTLPSPPSATGMDRTSQPGNRASMRDFIMAQISAEDSVPLNESGISTAFFIITPHVVRSIRFSHAVKTEKTLASLCFHHIISPVFCN